MTAIKCKLVIIGAGPGGYVAAIRAGQLGVDTVIVDSGSLGGTCLNIGCIPSKALIHAADEYARIKHFAQRPAFGITAGKPVLDLPQTMVWKDRIVKRLTTGIGSLLDRNKVKIVSGQARFIDGRTVEVTNEDRSTRIETQNAIIATGSIPAELPFLPFGGPVISSSEALSLDRVPDKLIVVGAGYIGLELGTAYAKLGSKVTIVEAEDRLLPAYDRALTKPVAHTLEKLGVDLRLKARVRKLEKDGKTLVIETANDGDDRLAADKILVATGRRARTEGWGRSNLVLDMDGPFIKIDGHCQTSMHGIYAIGDVTGEPMLAHRAMAQGELVAEIIAGSPRRWDKTAIPAICFTDPEIVTVGLSPDQARVRGLSVKTAEFPFQANGRAMTQNAETGFVRVVARSDDHLILGIQAVGSGVCELSSSFGLALEMQARLEDIAETIHAHPTQGEALQEAAMRTNGHALHI